MTQVQDSQLFDLLVGTVDCCWNCWSYRTIAALSWHGRAADTSLYFLTRLSVCLNRTEQVKCSCVAISP